MIVEFPTLYKKTSVGANQQWTIEAVNNTIVTHWGQVGGKIQVTVESIKEGKNIGKANETTPEKQAELEARSRWELKLKKGYVQSLQDAIYGMVDNVIAGGIAPMLAKNYKDHKLKVNWPAYVQPKLDGHRCIAMFDGNKCTLWSRTRKLIESVPHINKAVERACAGTGRMILDGELYNHEFKKNFEELTHFITSDEPAEGHEVVQYHIYDHVNKKDFGLRYADLTTYVLVEPLRLVETVLVLDEDEMKAQYNRFLDMEYEGAIVRNKNGGYVNKRTVDLLKVKQFEDAEFRVIGIEEGRGKLAGHAIFICVTKDEKEFNVKMKGDTAKLKKYFDYPDDVMNRHLTVQFQGYTRYGKPRFPVGLRFREDV